MGDVVDMQAYREDPHLAGEAHCMACGHDWVAVVPVGETHLDCPGCGMTRGVLRYPCEREEAHWTCNCGNQLFKVSPSSIYCPQCGANQVFELSGG